MENENRWKDFLADSDVLSLDLDGFDLDEEDL